MGRVVQLDGWLIEGGASGYTPVGVDVEIGAIAELNQWTRGLIDPAPVEYLPVWVDTIGGAILDGLEVTRASDEGEPVAVNVALNTTSPSRGHEAEHGRRRTHLHIGPEEDHRVAVLEPVTLEDIAAKVVSTHINLS